MALTDAVLTQAGEEEKYLLFVNPATGEQFGRVAMSHPEEAPEIMEAMRHAQQGWAARPPAERARLLGKFQKLLIDSLDEISRVMNLDTGKNRQDALIEAWMSIELLDVYRRHARAWLKPERVPRGYFFFKRCYVEHRPYGVVLVIAPWNYPFYLAMPPVIGALLAGNTVILKPSEVTAATGVLMEQLFNQIPELAPYIKVVHGDGSVGAALVNARPDYIFLTGSTATGRIVLKNAAENFIPVACELGGKDPVIVLEDADVEAAARWAVWGSNYNTGQTCMAVERVYVMEQVYDEFVQKAVEYTNQLKIGFTEELESPYYVGPMSDPRQIKIINRQMADALAKGAKVLTGGNQEGMFIDPIVMVDVDHSMVIMQDETFGPILPVMKVQSDEEAIRMANDSQYGLGASIWSRDIPRAERMARQIQAGSILINDTIAQIAIPMLPFGGMKHSGYGRVHGKDGLLQFTQTVSYAVSRPPNPLDLAVILRKPGHYRLGSGFIHLLFGTRPSQRLKGLKQLLHRQ